LLNVPDQIPDFDIQRVCDDLHRAERNALLASLDSVHVRPVQAGSLCKFILREAVLMPLPDRLPDLFLDGLQRFKRM
jgi:hypothetical protein